MINAGAWRRLGECPLQPDLIISSPPHPLFLKNPCTHPGIPIKVAKEESLVWSSPHPFLYFFCIFWLHPHMSQESQHPERWLAFSTAFFLPMWMLKSFGFFQSFRQPYWTCSLPEHAVSVITYIPVTIFFCGTFSMHPPCSRTWHT